MSKSTVIKEQIMEILRDNQEHTASDIKVTIRKKYPDMDITEGVFSNSFRTLTLAGKCINKERGVYVLNSDKRNVDPDAAQKDEGEKENKCCNAYLKLHQDVSELLVKWREEFRNLVKDINILDADDEVVAYILEVRHALENLEKGIKRDAFN